jgi:hypothetical protein
METKILLPFREVKTPSKWFDLPSNFLEAIELTHRCCGKDQSQMETFVHINDSCIEAIGAHQVGCYRIKTPIDKNILVHKDSIKHITPLGMTECGVTKKWIHFRNPADVVLSCLRWPQADEYPDTNAVLSAKKGKKINIPRSLKKSVNRAQIFSRENPDDTDIEIKLKKGKLICKGTGLQGDHKEPHKINYTGENMSFSISPSLLADLCQRHTEAWITPTTLTVKSGKFTFVTALGVDNVEED